MQKAEGSGFWCSQFLISNGHGAPFNLRDSYKGSGTLSPHHLCAKHSETKVYGQSHIHVGRIVNYHV